MDNRLETLIKKISEKFESSEGQNRIIAKLNQLYNELDNDLVDSQVCNLRVNIKEISSESLLGILEDAMKESKYASKFFNILSIPKENLEDSVISGFVIMYESEIVIGKLNEKYKVLEQEIESIKNDPKKESVLKKKEELLKGVEKDIGVEKEQIRYNLGIIRSYADVNVDKFLAAMGNAKFSDTQVYVKKRLDMMKAKNMIRINDIYFFENKFENGYSSGGYELIIHHAKNNVQHIEFLMMCSKEYGVGDRFKAEMNLLKVVKDKFKQKSLLVE